MYSMRSILTATVVTLVSFSAALAACSSAQDSGSSSAGGGAGTGGETSSSSASTGEPSLCASDPRAQSYAIGLASSSDDGTMKATFMDADPAPPSKGNNTWKVKLVDGSGAAISGATITAKPWMPDHVHGSSITPQVAAGTDAGEYDVTLLNFFMPGIWQITLHVVPTSGPAENLVFTFCVDG